MKNINSGKGIQINVEKNEGSIFSSPNNNDSEKNKNFFDNLKSLPTFIKVIIPIFIIIIIILVSILLKKGYNIETPYLSIKKQDTLIKKPEKELENKSEKPKKMSLFKNIKPENKISKNENSGNGAMNVNSGSGTQINIEKNEGIVAPNSTFVNTELPPRTLVNPEYQQGLETFILNLLKENNKDKTCPIRIRADYSSQEAINYGNEILRYLKSKKYNVIEEVFHEIFAPQFHQTEIHFGKAAVYGDTSNIIQIRVGLNKPR